MWPVEKVAKILICAVVLIAPYMTYAGEIKARAREHIDFHRISFSDGGNNSYSGLSNTINIWWEKPRIYSVGLAFNPILGSAMADSEPDIRLSDEVKLITLGMEGKYYHRYVTNKLFSRLGLGATRLDTNSNIDNVDGYHAYIGAGWEFDVKGVGIALEMAFRHSRLAQNIVVNSITPSVGVHFYH